MDNIILYLLTVIQEQYKTICWLLNFICRYIPLKQWAFDDSHSLNTTNLPLTASLSSSLSSNKTGSSYWNTTSGSMVKPSGRSSGATGNPFPRIPSVPSVALPTTISMIIMAATDSTSARSVDRRLSLGRLLPPQSVSVCPYCGHTLVPKRTGGSSASTNVSIQSVPSICITSPGLRKTSG